MEFIQLLLANQIADIFRANDKYAYLAPSRAYLVNSIPTFVYRKANLYTLVPLDNGKLGRHTQR